MPKQLATIHGKVTYTEGDGMPIPIPEGEVELDMADDSVTMSWAEGEDARGLTAMPRNQFDQYVEAGKIRIKDST